MGFLLQLFQKLSAGMKFSLYEIFAFTENWECDRCAKFYCHGSLAMGLSSVAVKGQMLEALWPNSLRCFLLALLIHALILALKTPELTVEEWLCGICWWVGLHRVVPSRTE